MKYVLKVSGFCWFYSVTCCPVNHRQFALIVYSIQLLLETIVYCIQFIKLYHCFVVCFYQIISVKGGVEDTTFEDTTQGHNKNPNPRPRTDFMGTDTLKVKDRNVRTQGQLLRTQGGSVLTKKQVPNFFSSSDLQKQKRFSCKETPIFCEKSVVFRK